MVSRLYQKGLKMSLKRELSEELRRLFIANGMIGQFIFNVARSNLAEYEVDSLIEEVNVAMRELEDSGGDPWMDLGPSAQRPDKLN
jgi:hypothetical protein